MYIFGVLLASFFRVQVFGQQSLGEELREWQQRFNDAISVGDARELVRTFYHPHGALIANGQVFAGQPAITAAWTKLAPSVKGRKFETRHDWFAEIDNWYSGKRVFLKATTSPAQDPWQASSLIMELVKPSSNGTILIVRDYVKP